MSKIINTITSMYEIIHTLTTMKNSGELIELSLYPRMGSNTIDKHGNRLLINQGKNGIYHDIDEDFYDELVDIYDSRG